MRYKLKIIPLFLLLCTSSVHADWINLTGAETAPNIAEIYVLDDHIRVNLEVYVGDLDKFEELVPDEWLKDPGLKHPSLEQRMKTFATQRFQIVTENGKNLPAHLKLVEPRMRVDRKSPFAGMINPMTRQRVPEAPEDKRVLYAEIIYPFKKKPQQLTFIPPLGEKGIAQVNIGFIAFHKAVPVIDFRYLGQPAKLILNWDDPWYTRFSNPNLKRHHKSALMSFLYIEPYEVRHELLIRVKDMQNWMDLGLRGKNYIEVDELEPLQQRIGEFLLNKNTVLIDGKAIKPILDRSNYVKLGLRGIQLLEQPQRLEISTAIVGVIIAYITDELPKEVTVDWELFTDKIQKIPAIATDPAGPLPSFIEPDGNIFKWTNFLKKYTPPTVEKVDLKDTVNKLEMPLLTLVFLFAVLPVGVWTWRKNSSQQSIRVPVALGLILITMAVVLYPYVQINMSRPAMLVKGLDEQEARLIISSLLKNIYRAFDFREESDVYDKLALSVQGDLLADIYLQNRKSFAIKKAGGAQARVKKVEILSVTAEPLPEKALAFVLNTKWTAMGTVGHWGHVHTRRNYYDANVTVEVMDGAWKITGLELLEEKRIDPNTTITKAADKQGLESKGG